MEKVTTLEIVSVVASLLCENCLTKLSLYTYMNCINSQLVECVALHKRPGDTATTKISPALVVRDAPTAAHELASSAGQQEKCVWVRAKHAHTLSAWS